MIFIYHVKRCALIGQAEPGHGIARHGKIHAAFPKVGKCLEKIIRPVPPDDEIRKSNAGRVELPLSRTISLRLRIRLLPHPA